MIREIKFRVWLPYNKIMMRSKDIIEIQESQISNCTIGQMKQWIWLQYTGLKDKNGNEIYEGDILASICNSHGHYLMRPTVEFNNCCFILTSCKPLQEIIGTPYEFLKHYSQGQLEIIGNIYQNPELINKENHTKNFLQ